MSFTNQAEKLSFTNQADKFAEFWAHTSERKQSPQGHRTQTLRYMCYPKRERVRACLPLAPPARSTKASKQCEAMGANTRRRNGALGATKLEPLAGLLAARAEISMA